MTTQYYGFDWLAMICGLSGTYLLGSRSKYGFVFCMLGSSAWLAVGFLVNSLPLIVSSFISIALHLRGFLNWRRERQGEEIK